MKILIASNNRHKIEEIQDILDSNFDGKIKLLSPKDLNIKLDVKEDADTLEGNALLKAQAYFRQAEIPVIADDTGLEIDYLQGAPGVFSARFAGEPANDKNNRSKALSLLKDIPVEERTASFRTVICYLDNQGHKFIEGRCEGIIIDEERGGNGFGYDSIFKPEGYEKTFAQMPPAVKNKISHRGKAIMNFINFIAQHLQS